MDRIKNVILKEDYIEIFYHDGDVVHYRKNSCSYDYAGHYMSTTYRYTTVREAAEVIKRKLEREISKRFEESEVAKANTTIDHQTLQNKFLTTYAEEIKNLIPEGVKLYNKRLSEAQNGLSKASEPVTLCDDLSLGREQLVADYRGILYKKGE